MGKEHQKLKQSFICKTFWNAHLPTSWLQILASPFINKHSPLQSCWSWKASARAKQGQYTSILPPVLILFLPATNTSALTLCDKLKSWAGILLTGTQEASSFLVHVLTLHEFLHRFCICSWSQQPPRCLLHYMFNFGWFLLEYTTFHCLALESQLHKKNECSLFYSTAECSLSISCDDDFFPPAQEIGNIQWNHWRLIPVLHTCSPAYSVICFVVFP